MSQDAVNELVEETALAARDAAEPDGHPRWRVTLYTCWVAQLCAMIGFAFVMPFIPFYVRDLGVTESAVPLWSGLLSSATGLAMSIMAPVWGYLADRHSRKLMVQRAMFGGALILSSMAYVRNVHQLFGLRVLQGAVTGTVSASVALVSSVVPMARMGFALGLMQTAVFAGNSIGPYLGGIAADHLGYRTPFLMTGGILLVAGVTVLAGARERRLRHAPDAHSAASSFRTIIASPGVLVLLSVYTLMNLSGSFVAPIFPLFVEKVANAPGQAASATGFLFMIQGLAAAFSSVVAGRLCDRYGYKPVLVSCSVFAGVICFPHLWAQNTGQLVALRALAGLGAGGVIPAMNAMMAGAVSRRHLGKAYGLTTTAGAFGWGTGPVLGGLAAGAFGLRVPFAIMGGLLLVMAVLAQFALSSRNGAENGPAAS